MASGFPVSAECRYVEDWLGSLGDRPLPLGIADVELETAQTLWALMRQMVPDRKRHV